jgi:hypothetical protein
MIPSAIVDFATMTLRTGYGPYVKAIILAPAGLIPTTLGQTVLGSLRVRTIPSFTKHLRRLQNALVCIGHLWLSRRLSSKVDRVTAAATLAVDHSFFLSWLPTYHTWKGMMLRALGHSRVVLAGNLRIKVISYNRV